MVIGKLSFSVKVFRNCGRCISDIGVVVVDVFDDNNVYNIGVCWIFFWSFSFGC